MSRFELGLVLDKSRVWHGEAAMSPENVRVFTWQVFEVSPGEQSCDAVVIHMQKRHLVLFLPQNKENLQQIKSVNAVYEHQNSRSSPAGTMVNQLGTSLRLWGLKNEIRR